MQIEKVIRKIKITNKTRKEKTNSYYPFIEKCSEDLITKDTGRYY